jgi:hypothetical protein
VIVLEAITCCPGSADVIALLFISVSVELRDKSFESRKELHGVVWC